MRSHWVGGSLCNLMSSGSDGLHSRRNHGLHSVSNPGVGQRLMEPSVVVELHRAAGQLHRGIGRGDGVIPSHSFILIRVKSSSHCR